MKAVGQERRSAAQPPRHPSGQKIGGDGTWGEGRPPFAETGPISTSTAPDKRGSPVPAIAIGGASGEAPTATATSVPDKRGGSAPQAMLGGPGTERSVEGGGPAPDEPRDPCAKTPAIHAEGSQQPKERAPEGPRSSGVEVACHRGKVHSAAAGSSETRTVPSAAAPDGAFTVLTGEQAKSPPQGPAGGFADAPSKSAGYGTERIDVGSCAPQDPSMTVRMPPSHPAMGAALRQRPTPSVPAFGARAALTASKDDDVGTKAPRGLGVSQVHLSGPMLYPGPRLPRTDSLAETPSGSLADDSAPAGQRQAAAPSGTAGAGQAKGAETEGLFTPTAAQAAASARGGGGGGGLTAAQQHATNAIRMDEIKGDVAQLDSALPGLKKDAEEAAKQLAPLKEARDEHFRAQANVDAAKQSQKAIWEEVKKEIDAGTFVEGGESEQRLNAANDAVKAAEENAKAKQFSAENEYQEKKKDADKEQRKVDENQEQWSELESERQALDAKNDKLEQGMDPTDEARAEKDKKRLKRDQDRQAEIADKLEKARQARATRNSNRPDYRATQRAKARRADNKRSKSLAKAKKLLKIAQNKNLSAKARKSALAKAKKQVQKAKQAALDKLDALEKAKASDAEKKEAKDELKEVAEVEKKIEEAEEDLEEEEQEPPPPDPCLLPCDCNIPCESPDRCICSRQPTGGTPVPEGGGGGGAAEPAPPDVKIPEGSTAADEGNGDGDGDDSDEKKPSEKGTGNRGPLGPPGGRPEIPGGDVFCCPQGDDGRPAGPGPGGPGAAADAKSDAELKKELQDGTATAAEKLSERKPRFHDGADEPLASCPKSKSKSKWRKKGRGIVTDRPSEAIKEIFEDPSKFGFDCTSATAVAAYKATLDNLGAEKFDQLFMSDGKPLLFILGSQSSGFPDSAKVYEQLGRKPGPALIEEVNGGPFKKGDIRYITPGGQNIIQMADGDVTRSSKVYGHGGGDAPSGIQTAAPFIDHYNGTINDVAWRLNSGTVKSAMK